MQLSDNTPTLSPTILPTTVARPATHLNPVSNPGLNAEFTPTQRTLTHLAALTHATVLPSVAPTGQHFASKLPLKAASLPPELLATDREREGKGELKITADIASKILEMIQRKGNQMELQHKAAAAQTQPEAANNHGGHSSWHQDASLTHGATASLSQPAPPKAQQAPPAAPVHVNQMQLPQAAAGVAPKPEPVQKPAQANQIKAPDNMSAGSQKGGKDQPGGKEAAEMPQKNLTLAALQEQINKMSAPKNNSLEQAAKQPTTQQNFLPSSKPEAAIQSGHNLPQPGVQNTVPAPQQTKATSEMSNAPAKTPPTAHADQKPVMALPQATHGPVQPPEVAPQKPAAAQPAVSAQPPPAAPGNQPPENALAVPPKSQPSLQSHELPMAPSQSQNPAQPQLPDKQPPTVRPRPLTTRLHSTSHFNPSQNNMAGRLATATRPEMNHHVQEPTVRPYHTPMMPTRNKKHGAIVNDFEKFNWDKNTNRFEWGLSGRKHLNDYSQPELMNRPTRRPTPRPVPVRTAPMTKVNAFHKVTNFRKRESLC